MTTIIYRLMKEIEVKLLNINVDEVRGLLEGIKAKKVFEERLYKRIVFFDKDGEWKKKRGWVRLRDEVDKVTLAYKEQSEYSIDGMIEVSFEVEEFNKTREFLNAIGLKEINYQENKREEWKTDDAVFEIDTWPLLPTYLEIEAESEEIIKKYIKLLNFEDKEQIFGGAGEVYMKKLGINIDEYPVLTFDTKL